MRNRWTEAAAVVVVVLLVLVAGVAFFDSDGSGGDASPAPEAVSERASSPPTSSPGPQEAAWAYRPHPERRYITIGSTGGRQFSETELQTIATSYGAVFLAKFHGGWDVTKHHEAVHRLEEINPAVDVYAYMSTKYWFDHNDWNGATIDPEWVLRSDAGEVVALTEARYDPSSKRLGSYVDLTSSDYRDWVLEVADAWMREAPYAGVRFDAADPIGDFGPRDVRKWSGLLSESRRLAYNEGIEALLSEADASLDSEMVFFNGISPDPIRGDGRDLELLEHSDGAMDEEFCVRADGEIHDVESDIAIMQRFADKRLHLRARYPHDMSDPDELRRIERFCTTAFLLGWQPGSTFFSMGSDYTVDQLLRQPVDIELDLGAPIGPMDQDGDLMQRHFDNGAVFLNLGTEAIEVNPAPGLVRVDDGMQWPVNEDGYLLPGQDAVAFLRGQLAGDDGGAGG